MLILQPKPGEAEVDVIPRLLVFSTYRIWLLERKVRHDCSAWPLSCRHFNCYSFCKCYPLSFFRWLKRKRPRRRIRKVVDG